MHVDRRLLGWGLFFILVGGIPLAVRANLLDATLVSQWPLLWPLLLIAWGIGLLLRGTPLDWIGGTLVAVTFGVMGGGLITTGAGGLPIATGCTSSGPEVPFTGRGGPLDATAQLNVRFSCGSLEAGTVDGTSWNLAGSDRDGTGPTMVSTSSLVSLATPQSNGFPGSGRSNWNLTIPRSPSITLGLTLDAGDGALKLDGASMASATVTLNAGKLDIDLGSAAHTGDVNATVNAGAGAITLDSQPRDVNVSINAGSLQICLPAAAPLLVNWSGALGSNNFSAAGLVRIDDTTWTSPGFAAGQPHMELHVSANAGSFELRFGGACHA